MYICVPHRKTDRPSPFCLRYLQGTCISEAEQKRMFLLYIRKKLHVDACVAQ
jgi:hypothetical protein